MVVSNVLEPVDLVNSAHFTCLPSWNLPMDLACIFKETESNAVNRSVTPSLIEKSSCSIKMGEVIFISLTPPKGKIGDLEIGPEVAGTVTMGLDVVVWSSLVVHQPSHGVILVQVLWVSGQEFDGLRPKRRDGFR